MTEGIAAIFVMIIALLALLATYAVIKTAFFLTILTAIALAVFYCCLGPSMRRTLQYRPAIVAVAMPLVAWGAPSVWLLHATMLLLVPFLARRPGEVAPLYLFSLLLLPGLDQSISIGSLKLFDFGVHDALAIGAMIRLLPFAEGRLRGILRLDLPVLTLVLLLAIAFARDTSVTHFFRLTIDMALDYAVPYFIVSRSVRSFEDIRLCMVWLACGAAIISVVLLYEARTSWPMYNSLYERYGVPELLLVKTRGGVLRAAGPFLESTAMAMVLTLCFLAAWLSHSAFRSKRHHLCVLLLLLAGLVAPQSRGAWLGLLIGMLATDLYRGRYRLVIWRLMLVGAAGGILLSLAHINPYLSETMGLAGGSVDTVEYRERLLQRGIEEFRDSPITGHSWPEIQIRMEDMRQGEGIIDFVNSYVFVALISGAIGLAIFVGAFIGVGGLLWLRRPTLRRVAAADGPVTFVFAALVSAMAMLAFTSFGGRSAVFLFLFLAFAAAIHGHRRPPGVKARGPLGPRPAMQ